MRFKIKTPNEQTYRDVQETLRARNVTVYVTSDRRRTISTGNIPAKLRADIAQRGAQVTADQQYDLEKVSAT